MNSLSLSGPWAELERRSQQDKLVIQQLQENLLQWQEACQQRDSLLESERARLQGLEGSKLPDLQNQLHTAQEFNAKLQTELEQQKQAVNDAQQSAAAAVAALQSKLETASADNAVLRAELTKAVQLRQVTHAKVEEARRKLGLGQSEAEFFIKDLDETKASNKVLKGEVSRLTVDKARLEQQCDSRSTHAMTLIAENRRLLEQVSDLRRQAVAADQDIWRLKQDLAAAQKLGAKAAKRREATASASQARPEWQGGPTRPAAKHAPAAAAASHHLAPPPSLHSQDIATVWGLDQHCYTCGPHSAGGEGTQPPMQPPMQSPMQPPMRPMQHHLAHAYGDVSVPQGEEGSTERSPDGGMGGLVTRYQQLSASDPQGGGTAAPGPTGQPRSETAAPTRQHRASEPGVPIRQQGLTRQRAPLSQLVTRQPGVSQPLESSATTGATSHKSHKVVGAVEAVKAGAEQLEQLRRAALQQAMACRQQRRVSSGL